MRLLLLGLNYAPEEIGIGLYSGEMLQSWAAAGHRADAVVAQPYYPRWRVFDCYGGLWRASEEQGVGVIRCPLYVPARPAGARRILHHLSFAASSLVPLLGRALRRRPHIVMTTAPSLIAAPVALLAAKICGARSWLHVQDFEIEAAFATGLVSGTGPGARLARWFEARVLRAFDMVSSISPQMCARLAEKGVKADRIYEFRNWADIDGIRPGNGQSPYREEWAIGDRHVALYSGNLGNKQGIEIIVEAARLLHQREDLVFVICGDGSYRQTLEREAAGLPNLLIRDLQPRERLNDLLGMASVHLLPQIAGAADLLLPSKLTNMLASGRPVVATAEPGTGLWAEVEGAGLTVSPGDAPAFAAAIGQVIDRPEDAARMGAAARQRAEERWSRKTIMDRFMRKAAELAGSSLI